MPSWVDLTCFTLLRATVTSLLLALCPFTGLSQTLSRWAPDIISITRSNSQVLLEWEPLPAAENYQLLRSGHLDAAFAEDPGATIEGFSALVTMTDSVGLFRVASRPLDTNVVLAATALNRLSYGPTPEEWDRVLRIGPDTFIQEQLAPELIQETLDFEQVITNPSVQWQFFSATGTASRPELYVYLNAPGEGYIDDMRFVAGTNAVVGVNLIRNGDFENPLTTNDWTVSDNMAGSVITTEVSHSGNASLHLVASRAGETLGSSIWQSMSDVTLNARYTLSYWYLPSTNGLSSPTVRLSGSGVVSSPLPLTTGTLLTAGAARLDDLRAWHLLRGLQSKRQLLEILSQFLENHFVTQHEKSGEYLDTYYDDSGLRNRLATRMEYVENRRWREALLNPRCTFGDLLKVSAESPAMIIYLDTVTSRGDGRNIANENYARELFELFSFGVDNGYDQSDIVEMSKVWTGWRVRLVDQANEFDPFASQSTTILPGSTNTSTTSISNLVGVWAFNYRSDRHNTNDKSLFLGKTIPSRFGPPYTTRTYGAGTAPGRYDLVVRGRTGANGIQEGYEAVAYLADLPFTQEFISAKLCRLFVHDDFQHGVYNYTDPNLSREGRLVRDCMAAWESGSPKGQIRDILRVIFNSELFRGNDGSMQKVKTPLEFILSALRAMRAEATNRTFTAGTDGYSLITPLDRMGGMKLFDRSDPDGYPESGEGWISAGTLAERLRFVQALCVATNQAGHSEAGLSFCDPAALLRTRLPSEDLTNASAVVDCLLGLLFPAEGKANLDLYRGAGLRYLNQSESGQVSSPFSNLSMAGNPSPYSVRVRGLTAMLLSSPRFQEQ
jgi:uncharacterized protein (DUF1800 family)